MGKVKATLAIILSTSLLFGCSQKSEEVKTSEGENGQVSNSVLEGRDGQYREYAINEIEAFVTATKGFTNAVLDGDVEKAKELYAPARMHYEPAQPIAEVIWRFRSKD